MKHFLLVILIVLSTNIFSQQCTPSVSIQVINGPICLSPASYNYNTNIYNFVATPVNGGTFPTYEWQKNGVVFNGITGPICSVKATTMSDGDVFKCTMTSSAACADPTTAVGSYKISYFKAVFPTTSSVTPTGKVSLGTNVDFTMSVNNHPGGPMTSILYYYFFYINGVQAPTYLYNSFGQTTNSVVIFSTNTLKDGDIVFCTTIVHNIGNPCEDIDTSNSITMSVITVLPLTLSQFNIKSLGDKFSLNWTTATETNTDNFNVQVSTDGISFVDVGKVKAAGSSTTLQSYNYTYQPTSFSNETYYFRLKTDDKDGRYTMSPIRSSSLFGDFQVTISPNPAKDIVNVKGAAIKQVQLFDLSGKLLVDKTTSSNNASIDVSNISRGIYLLRITNTNDKIQVQKVVLQ